MTVRIPPELLPGDGRFGSGPSKVRTEAVRALADAGAGYLGTSHRREGVRAVVRAAREGLTELFALPNGYEVLLGTGGSTLFWDAAAFGLVVHRAEHLVFGEFSSKFAAVTAGAPFLDDPFVIESEPGTHPDLVVDGSVDVYAFPHNETSTGVMMDVRRPAKAEGLMLVDGASSAAGLRVDPTQFDAYYFAPQKAFAADAGIWVALCSPAAIERIERVAATGRWVPPSLSLPIALENSRLDQTYNTPPLASIFLLADSVRWMLDNGGLEWTTSRCDQSAEIVYGWAEASAHATPYVAKPSERSRTIACIDFVDTVDAAAVAVALRDNSILDTESYRKLGRNQLRIALFPAIEPDDVAALTRCIDFVIDALSPPNPNLRRSRL
ncbi:MAG: phosphoserine transaminase [Acidimicrobiia bacterium]